MKINLTRWSSFVFVFLILTSIWTTLAAAAPHENIETMTPPSPGVIEPGDPTFSIIIGAIVIVTIIIASSVFRKREFD